MSPTIIQVGQVTVVEDFCTRQKTYHHLTSQQKEVKCDWLKARLTHARPTHAGTHFKASHALGMRKRACANATEKS